MSLLTGRRPFLAASLASLLPCAARADASRLQDILDRAFRPLIATHDIPGMSVGITLDGRRHVAHYGLASRESGAPVTDDTVFEIGSLSKPFTATMATHAQALGRLSLDDSPARAVPALRGSALEAATLLHLGTYTAGGLPLQFPQGIDQLDAALAFFRKWTPAVPPGEQRRYSNPSIGLLGHAVAQAMGAEFGELAQAFYARLGLRHTFVRVPASHLPAYAWGYDKALRPTRVNPGVFDAQAYGVKTTVGDMLGFIERNIDPSSLEPALRQAVRDTHVPRFRIGPMVQGLGWEQYPYPVTLDRLRAGNASTMALEPQAAQAISPSEAAVTPRVLFNKTGSTNGFGAYAAFVPAQRLGIVMLANRNVPIPARLDAAHAVLQQLAPG